MDELALGNNIINAAGDINEVELAKVKATPEMVRDLARFKSGYEEAKKILTQINDFVDRRTSILATWYLTMSHGRGIASFFNG